MEDFNSGSVGKNHPLWRNYYHRINNASLAALLVIVICIVPMTTASSKTISVNPGLYYEEQATPIFYDHYIPVILQYKTPAFNKTELTFNNWFNCTSEKYPYSLSCPVVFHLNAALQNLHIDFESIQPGRDDEDFSHAQHFNTLSKSKEFCNKIQNHFPDLYINATDISRYYHDLQQCKKNFPIDKNVTNYRYEIRSPFSRMEFNFYSIFFQPVSNRTKDADVRLLASASLSNSRVAIQGSVMASFYAERNRWSFALTNCLQNKLPPSLVTQSKLEEILAKIRSESDAQITSISNSSITRYFSLPLTDCTHTLDELVVRLLVPMISSSRERFRLLSTQPIQFQVENALCFLKSSREPSMYLFDVEQELAYKSSCKSNELCDVNSHTEMDLCMSAIFAKNPSGILKYCQYTCEVPSQPFRIDLASKNTYAVTADSSSFVKITCQTKDAEVTGRSTETTERSVDDTEKSVEEQGPGTFLIKLLSKCTISLSSGSISTSVQSNLPPIDDNHVPFIAARTVPLNFLKEGYRTGNDFFEMEVEDTGYLDEDYVRGLFNSPANPASPMAQVQDRSSSNHTVLYLYITLLSILVAAMVICQYLLLKRLSTIQGTSLLATFQGESVNITSRDNALLMEECEYAQ